MKRLILIFPLLALGCGKPVPQDKASYIGEWKAVGMQLVISAEGRVEYERLKPGKVTISAPIQSFEGDDFLVGIPYLTTKFVVSKPPYRDGEQWKMVVDGVELVRIFPR